VGVVLIVLGLVYQFFFRYEYIPLAAVGIVRVDRLTGSACVAWPPNGTYASSYCGGGK
jgi:hypothetical protein